MKKTPQVPGKTTGSISAESWESRRPKDGMRALVYGLCYLVAAPWPFLIASLGMELSGHGEWRFWRTAKELEGALLFIIFGGALVAGIGFLLKERAGTRRHIRALQDLDREKTFFNSARYVFWKDLEVISGLFLSAVIVGVALTIGGLRVGEAVLEDDLLSTGTLVEAQLVRAWEEDYESTWSEWTRYMVEYRFTPGGGTELAWGGAVQQGSADVPFEAWEAAQADETLEILFDLEDPSRHTPLAAARGYSVSFFLAIGILLTLAAYPVWIVLAPAFRRR